QSGASMKTKKPSTTASKPRLTNGCVASKNHGGTTKAASKNYPASHSNSKPAESKIPPRWRTFSRAHWSSRTQRKLVLPNSSSANSSRSEVNDLHDQTGRTNDPTPSNLTTSGCTRASAPIPHFLAL